MTDHIIMYSNLTESEMLKMFNYLDLSGTGVITSVVLRKLN